MEYCRDITDHERSGAEPAPCSVRGVAGAISAMFGWPGLKGICSYAEEWPTSGNSQLRRDVYVRRQSSSKISHEASLSGVSTAQRRLARERLGSSKSRNLDGLGARIGNPRCMGARATKGARSVDPEGRREPSQPIVGACSQDSPPRTGRFAPRTGGRARKSIRARMRRARSMRMLAVAPSTPKGRRIDG